MTLLSAPLEGLKAPADVLAYGGTGPVDTTLGQFGALATQAGLPMPDPRAQIGLALKAELGLKDEKVIDLKRGVRFAVLNPKQFQAAPLALIFGITSKDAFVAALPDGKKADDEGNTYSFLKFPGSTEASYVNFTSDWVIVTHAPTLFPHYREFLELLAFSEVSDAGGAVVAIRNLTTIYGADLDAGVADFKKSMRANMAMIPGAAQQTWLVDALGDAVTQSARDLDTLRVTFDTLPDGLRLQVGFHPKVASELAKSFGELKGTGTGALLARMPADAPFFAWANLPTERLHAFGDKIAGMTVGAMLKDDPAKSTEYTQAMKDAVGSFSGEFVVAAHGPVGGDGLALTGLFGILDVAKARAAQTKLTGVYKEPGAMAYYQRVGLNVDMKPAAYAVGDTPVAVITTSAGDSNPQLKAMSAGLAELLTQHIALSKDLGVMAYGSDARKTVEAVLGGTLPGGLDKAAGPVRALKQAAHNPLMVVYVSPVDVARRVRMNGLNPMAALLKDISATSGIALSVGTDGGALEVVLDVPVEQVQKLNQAFQKTKGGGL